jgi:hypothetical protein
MVEVFDMPFVKGVEITGDDDGFGHGSGFEVRGSRFWVLGSRFGVRGSGFWVRGLRFGVRGSGFEVRGSRFWVPATAGRRGSRFGVQGSRFEDKILHSSRIFIPFSIRVLKINHQRLYS